MKSNTPDTIAPPTASSTLLGKLFAPKAPTPSQKTPPLKLIDWVIMIGISLFYAFFAFSNLGNTHTPQTETIITTNASIELSASDGAYINTIYWCLWDIPEISFSLELKNASDAEWTLLPDYIIRSNFSSWNGLILPYPAQQVRLTNTSGRDTLIGEFGIRDTNGNLLTITNSQDYPALFDEQDTIPKEISHLTSFYFDEVLYVPTAYEYLNGLPSYECTHPPLGKIFMALGTLIFGFNPFGIRFFGVLSGTLILPFLYLLGRNLTKNRVLGAISSFIFAFDFMHYTQTRLATLDGLVTFFIVIMFYFMSYYLSLSIFDTNLKKLWLPLGFCGIFFGFSISTKWTGFYAGAGLAILFFTRILTNYREYRYALLSPEGNTCNISHKHIIATFKKNTLKTILFCIFFFVIIPFFIYLGSYIPFVDINNQGLLNKMIANQQYMFNYHSNVELTNPYSSRWYEWPFIIRPILYYFQYTGSFTRQSICAMGNPLVWWVGIPAFLYTMYLAIRKKQPEAKFLCVAYLSQYVPWIFISRMTFIYHYFPCVPFLALMIGYCFLQLKDMTQKKNLLDEKAFYALAIFYAIVTFGLFQMFLPVLSGKTVGYYYVTDFLQWLEDWKLILL